MNPNPKSPILSMDDLKLNQFQEKFLDAFDDFPFDDCSDTFSDESEFASHVSSFKPSTENFPATLLRRRKRNQAPVTDSLVSSESYLNIKIKENGEIFDDSENLSNSFTGKFKYKLASEVNGVNGVEKESNTTSSTITDANDKESEDNRVLAESDSRETSDMNSSFLLLLASLVIKALGFQINMFVQFFVFPIWLIYKSYMFVVDPFRLYRRARQFIVRKVANIWIFFYKRVSKCVYEWLKERKSMAMLVLKCGWGLLWSFYVCAVLLGLLASAFVIGGLVSRRVVEEPIRMNESLNFDYTEKSPVAFVPIMECPGTSHDLYSGEKSEFGMASGARVIPPYHKLQVNVLLTLPESDYNQNLGIFQVRVDFLAADGKVLASSRRPCMLQYRSLPIRLLLTFLKVAPILTGHSSEAQHLKINFRGFHEGKIPTSCLRVSIERRAEFVSGAGIPEVYAASLSLESELPFLRRVIWYWRKTLFVWISMTVFTMELLFALLCCNPIIMPRIRLKVGNALAGAEQGRSSS